MKQIKCLLLVVWLSSCFVIGCAKSRTPPVADVQTPIAYGPSPAASDSITLQNNPTPSTATTSTENVQMESRFSLAADGVNADIKITGLIPLSEHGVHIHENGQCISPDYASAGQHFNPDSKSHGDPNSKNSHFGDLGNIKADAEGHFAGVLKIKQATNQGRYNLLNRSLIIHEKTDDLKTQPAGDSGKRIACAIISTIQK